MTPSFFTAPSDQAVAGATALSDQMDLMGQAAARHAERLGHGHAERAREWFRRGQAVMARLGGAAAAGTLPDLIAAYARDAAERGVLTLDALRERGNNDIAHQAEGTPPVLVYDYETVVDGAGLRRPVNYMLLRILPPAGVEVNDRKRPYVIIDPRAGHGAGIGGFKADSQVGVALHAGHPVYFVAFRPHPEPGQTLADVTFAEGEFIRTIARRHPDSPKPIVVGNCQGGWATLLLAATNPDLTGPLVINGAPVATWSGRIGESPMRYNGGLLGGVLPALVLSDLGGGEFDGAHLVSNFEMLNPARNYFGKYYDLYADVDGAREKFLEFERWWGGYHFMNEAEIHWIVEQLFVGNRLARGEARLERGRPVDIRQIRSPIIVFASRGDNITPPQQALNWIADAYADEHEIKIRGQRIVYMVHDKVGHLGIFVSSSIARREHTEVTSTLQTIEALAPGLYEMRIDDQVGEGIHAHFTVSFHERRMEDVRHIDGSHRREEVAFAAVDRLSRLGAEVYDMALRPARRAAVTPVSVEAFRELHPGRVGRLAFSDRNPLVGPVAAAADRIRAERKPVPADHPVRQMERLWADAVEQSLDLMRDVRDAWFELAFLGLHMSPVMQMLGRSHNLERTRADSRELHRLPEVQTILAGIERGGLAEGVIRMLVLLAHARGSVRRDRLERSSEVMSRQEPFTTLGPQERVMIIHEQTVIVEFERARAIETLPKLIRTPAERRRALQLVDYIAGPAAEMEPHTVETLAAMREALKRKTLEVVAPPAGKTGTAA
ncbi:DUF3141 domain-containing protein [Prosthecomicrobium sp. N25]|uniref:DUF3141 domain-containing protein n=1 Tax=Prosthecomicrobium sp. N25 TaxID=3129254 RepID=UPI00307688D6